MENDCCEPIKQVMNVVQLLDFTYGNRRTTDGPKIGIMTLACGDEIESPMMFSLDDTERLFTKVLLALAAHGHEFANYLLEKYYTEDDSTGMDEFVR